MFCAFSLILAHQMFEKWSETAVFCTFLLQNVRFATAACMTLSFLTFSLANVGFATGSYNFVTSELTKVVQTRHVLCIFTNFGASDV